MSQAIRPANTERLPWLANEPQPVVTSRLRELAGWLVAAVLLLGIGASWLIMRVSDRGPSPRSRPVPAAIVALPPARPHGPERDVLSKQSRPSPNVPEPQSALVQRSRAEATRQVQSNGRAMIRNAPPSKRRPQVPVLADIVRRVSSAEVVQRSHLVLRPASGATPSFGCVVQVGAFLDMDQGELVWRDMVRALPAVEQVRASVIQNRDWNGQTFYQFQIRTGSRKDSQLLCRSMVQSNIRCEEVRFPWTS